MLRLAKEAAVQKKGVSRSSSIARTGSTVASEVHSHSVPYRRRHGHHETQPDLSGVVMPAPSRQSHARTTLQAPTAALQASHTSISLPLGPVDLFGNYSVLGPAIIRKINNALVALVQPGGAISVLNSSSTGPTYMSCASLSHDEDASAVVNLAGHHMELEGLFELHDMQRMIEHDGKVIVSPAALSEDSCILLLPGGSVSHPVNVHPHSP